MGRLTRREQEIGKAMRLSRQMVHETDPDWVRFWEVYPRREAKLDARKAWAQLHPDAALVDTIIQALGWQRQTDGWRRGFVPLPASYLRGQRWTDEQPVQAQRVMGDAAATVLSTLGVKP